MNPIINVPPPPTPSTDPNVDPYAPKLAGKDADSIFSYLVDSLKYYWGMNLLKMYNGGVTIISTEFANADHAYKLIYA